MITDQQLNRLPKFAQQEILHLRRRAIELEDKLELSYRAPDEGNVWWEEGIGKKHGLPNHATITFKTTSGIIHVRLESDKEEVYISAYTKSLIVRPWASNVIKAHCGD